MEDITLNIITEFPCNLNFLTDLINFDGPLLSLFENGHGDSYIYYWCDVDDNCNRWIVFRIIKSKLKQYIFKKLSLKDLILNPIDGFLYIIDIDDNIEIRNAYFIKPNELPELYVPKSDSYYDLESELDKESEKEILNYIIDDKEIIKILLKILNKYDYTLKEIKNKLFDILFTVHQKDNLIKKGFFFDNTIQRHPFSGAAYDRNCLIDDPQHLIAINNEVDNGY